MKIRAETTIRNAMRAPLLTALLAALVPALLAAVTPGSTQGEAAGGAPRGMVALDLAVVQEGPPDVAVQVDGLSCPFCAYGIEKKFVERPEVETVVVALEENEVHLWLRSEEELSDDAVRRTVEEAGFTPGEIRRPERSGATGR